MRVVILFVLLVAGIALPMGAMFAMALLGPPLYVLSGEGPGAEWLEERAFPDGSLVLVHRYETENEAVRAARRTVDTVSDGSAKNAFNVMRYYRSDRDRHGLVLPVGEYVVHVGAPSKEGVEARFQALDFVRENPQKNPLWVAFTDHAPIMFAGMGAYFVLYGLSMSRGASWAARVKPDAVAGPVPLSTLRGRLLEINQLNLPFHVTEERPGRFVAEWRIADARWIGLTEAGGLRKVHRLHIDLDERQHKARVLDRMQNIRWEAGRPRAVFSLAFFQGITFFQFERGMKAGLLYDRQAGWSIREAYSYRFSLSEMKGPLIEAVTQSGWTWQPVMTFFRPIGG